MLEADSAVAQYEQWLARDLEIAVCHRNGRFLMRAGEEFRFLIAAIVDQRFMQPAKALCRIARLRDIERLDNIDHEVGARRAGALR
jgi:hypothetical protein